MSSLLSSSPQPSGGAAAAMAAMTTTSSHAIIFSGQMLKAGDDNSRWKSRFFQLLSCKPTTTGASVGGKPIHVLRYFENERDASKPGKAPRGEILVSEVCALALFATTRSGTHNVDAHVQLLGELTSEHVQEGPSKLMIFCKERFWRLGETSVNSNAFGDLIRALDRVTATTHQIARHSLRMAGWMRAQGSLSWNRRYALLLSNGELIMFLDQNLDHLRRRIDLSLAQEIRSKQPLASSGSFSEKRVIRLLNASISDSSGGMWSVDMSDLLGIRLLHPQIPEKTGYIMCVERANAQEDSTQLYARFRKWIVQLQLSAAESRLARFQSVDEANKALVALAEEGEGESGGEDANDGALERKLLHLCHATTMGENAKAVAWEYLLRFGSFPLVHRSALWFVLFNGALAKRNAAATSYASLLDGNAGTECDRIANALGKLDSSLQHGFSRALAQMLLDEGGEECAFWTYLGAANHSPQLDGFLRGGEERMGADEQQTSLALHIEAHVIIDLLGMRNPQVIAHLSSYDLIGVLLKHLSREYLPTLGCGTPQMWDAASIVSGREVLSFCTVHQLSANANDLLECFTAEDVLVAVRRALAPRRPEERFPWKDFDSRIAQRLRKAQWATLVSTMQRHSQLLKSWRLAAGEVCTLVSKAVAQCNRLMSAGEEEADFDRVHELGVKLHRCATMLAARAEACERALEHQVLRSMAGSTGTSASSMIGGGVVVQRGNDASAVVVQVDELNLLLTCFAMSCLSLAWKAWNRANRMASTHRFIPRASLPNAPTFVNAASSTSSTGGGGSGGGSAAATPPAPASSTASMNVVPLTASQIASMASSSSSIPVPSAEDVTATAAPHDVSSMKGLANEIRRRLFTTGQQQAANAQLAAPSAASSRPPSPTSSSSISQFPPACPAVIHVDSAVAGTQLLLKFTGGFLGLCEFAGSSMDAALARDKSLHNDQLLHLLDVLDVMIRVASFATALQRWLLRRSSLSTPSNNSTSQQQQQHDETLPSAACIELPPQVRHLFIQGSIRPHRNELKLLEDALVEIQQRCKGGSNAVL